MSGKILSDVKMEGNGCSSYLGSMAGILKAAELWNDDFYKLAGMTGMAFHFIIEKQACPSSVTVYDWQQEHFIMMDRVGIQSEVFQYFYNPRLNTFDKVQSEAVRRIKESIDRGLAVVVWAPSPLLEFGLIRGYDDEDGVFLIQDCTCLEDPDPLLYENLGKSEVPILFYQIVLGKVDFPRQKTIRESLAYGIKEWEKEFHINPRYASGKKAYQNLISTLERNDFNPFGLSYNIFSYSKAKECLFKYLDFLSRENDEFKNLKKAAEKFKQVKEIFCRMEEIVPFRGQNTRIQNVDTQSLIMLLKEAVELEDKAMTVIRELIEEDLILTMKNTGC